jgi:hypothetical protein
MEQRSSLFQAIDALLGEESLADFIKIRRGYGAPLRRIARELTERTGVEINHATVSSWSEQIENAA